MAIYLRPLYLIWQWKYSDFNVFNSIACVLRLLTYWFIFHEIITKSDIVRTVYHSAIYIYVIQQDTQYLMINFIHNTQ